MLTLNAIWKGWYHPPNCRKIRKKKLAKAINMIFCKCYQNCLGQLLRWFLKLFQPWGLVTWPLLGVVYTKSTIFKVFENISASVWFFFMKSFLVTRSCQFLAVYMIMFDHECASYHGNQAQILSVFKWFWQFWALFGLSVLLQAFSLRNWFFYEKLVQYMYLHVW